MNTAIYYHPEGYTTTGPKLMGRHAAGESFLRGYFSYSKSDTFWAQTDHEDSFTRLARSYGRQEPVRVVSNSSLQELSKPGQLYLPGPNLNDFAWQRAMYGHRSWSLCGVTHTTSSARVMDSLTSLITAPVYPWDAVICTSNAVKDNAERLLQAQADYLVQRLGIQKLVLPLFPVIPLGIHTSDFTFSSDEKAAARKTIGASSQSIVVLFVGRLSFHAKAHPLAMYQALEKAAHGKEIILVECGWHANDYIARSFAEAALLNCPSVRVVNLDGRQREQRTTAWACADIFCSFSDNIQETFGISPIEAMAAGLPVVVSDWDGYKDTVRQGVEGFRIPTLMPGAGLGKDLALRHALEIDTYDMYCGNTCSLAAVDVNAAAQAFRTLFESSDMRIKMGEAAAKRAREMFDWKMIIPQYEALWEHLRQIRLNNSDKDIQLQHPWPARLDPFHGFSAYPSSILTEQTRLCLVDPSLEQAQERIKSYLSLSMVNFAQTVIPDTHEINMVLKSAAQGPKSAAELVQDIDPNRQAFVFRALTWLVKLNILQVNT